MEQIVNSFPELTETQKIQLENLYPLYTEWNQKINVISRKDIDNLYINHVLHSLTLCKFLRFAPGAKVLDLGTGGGFPAIPLAIFFPESHFTAIDGTGKKIKVVQEIADALQLKNIFPQQIRAEELKKKFHFIVSRAVADLDVLYQLSMPLLEKKQIQAQPNGLLVYKGGNIKSEIKALQNKSYYEIWKINDFFKLPFFDEKYIIYVQGGG